MKNKLWMAIFTLEHPICTCGRPMDVLEVTRFHKDYLILRATDDLVKVDIIKDNKDFYMLYSIKKLTTFGQAYCQLTRKEALKAITRFEQGIIK
jgi:ribosomal protein S4E